MLNPTPRQRSFLGLTTLALVFAAGGCDRKAGELAALKADNEHLRAELAHLREQAEGGKKTEAAPGKPDMILNFNDLYRQRFDDNEFRARQRLSGKTLRVTGIMDGMSGESLTLYGVGKSRNVRMTVNLERSHAAKIQDGLAALEKGVTLTVEGKFGFDRMELLEAAIVDSTSGTPMTTEQLQSLGQVAPADPPASEPPLPKTQ